MRFVIIAIVFLSGLISGYYISYSHVSTMEVNSIFLSNSLDIENKLDKIKMIRDEEYANLLLGLEYDLDLMVVKFYKLDILSLPDNISNAVKRSMKSVIDYRSEYIRTRDGSILSDTVDETIDSFKRTLDYEGSVSDRVGNSSSSPHFKYLPQPQHLVMKGGAGRCVSLPATK